MVMNTPTASLKAKLMRTPWFVRGDLDGFFGLFIDNLLQLFLIKALCVELVGLPITLVEQTILPGAAVSILLGNLFYSWQAIDLMRRTGRNDVTALPYGINTPSLIAFVLFIMAPVYHEHLETLKSQAETASLSLKELKTQAAAMSWRVGLFACLLSAVMETVGAFVGDWLRRFAPRAALLSALAGIAITFISMNFVFRIYEKPLIGLAPMLIVLIAYASRLKVPFGIPGGLLAVGLGVGLAWAFHHGLGIPLLREPVAYKFPICLPMPVPGDAFGLLNDPVGWKYLSVIFPMGLFNVLGSLQNLESAEASGDHFETRPSLLANGLGSLSAALFGSPFPTTIYIGHPGWKGMGARAGYSTANGVAIALLCFVGGVTLIENVVPLEATLGILLWVGVIITAQSFQEVPRAHALAVAVGLVPSLAAWAQFLVETTFRVGGVTEIRDKFEAMAKNDLYFQGLLALAQGFLLSSTLLAAIMVCVTDRKFLQASAWTWAAAAMAYTGVIHGFTLHGAAVHPSFVSFAEGRLVAAQPMGAEFAAMYALTAVVLSILHLAGFSEEGATNPV
jgi:AGZA family xanthine/uracil permease-like MFS transporter